MKRIPSPNYSLSIAVQENALRVMWLTLGASGAAAADQRLLAATLASEPRCAISAAMRQVFDQTFVGPGAFPRALVGTAGSAWSRSTMETCSQPDSTVKF